MRKLYCAHCGREEYAQIDSEPDCWTMERSWNCLTCDGWTTAKFSEPPNERSDEALGNARDEPQNLVSPQEQELR